MSGSLFGQRGFMDKTTALILVLVVLVCGALYVYLTMEFGEESGPPNPAIHPLRFESLADNEAFERWEGVLACGPSGQWQPFERAREVYVGHDLIGVERRESDRLLSIISETGGIPAKLDFVFEYWRGAVRNGHVVLEGWYTEGSNDVKVISMEGELGDGRLSLEGRRGPRTCTFVAER
ncbi:hypothetical protein [Marinimicrobium alkaliphilum]|uniref:hypothetical protein n=1 Tax=Marinimicrobium alkaliphilum TaxID=2202654 RepID=UPI00130032D0|nr:hypothetical protein [Marinimicrobium alkaliphilum]